MYGSVDGGHAPAEGSWPFVALFLKLVVPETDNSSAVFAGCTASIVGHRYVLTAAHCVDRVDNRGNINASDFEVRIGSAWRKNPISLNVSSVFTGPRWYRISFGNLMDDIALLELKAPIEFDDYAQPICLPKSFRERSGDSSYFVGWGRQNIVPEPHNETVDYDKWPEVANENIVTLRKWSHCGDYAFYLHREEFICTGQYMRGTRKGDSGGPLMVNKKGVWFQVGTTSGGWQGDGRGWGVFTRVTSYCKWFEDVTKGEATCVKP